MAEERQCYGNSRDLMSNHKRGREHVWNSPSSETSEHAPCITSPRTAAHLRNWTEVAGQETPLGILSQISETRQQPAFLSLWFIALCLQHLLPGCPLLPPESKPASGGYRHLPYTLC